MRCTCQINPGGVILRLSNIVVQKKKTSRIRQWFIYLWWCRRETYLRALRLRDERWECRRCKPPHPCCFFALGSYLLLPSGMPWCRLVKSRPRKNLMGREADGRGSDFCYLGDNGLLFDVMLACSCMVKLLPICSGRSISVIPQMP